VIQTAAVLLALSITTQAAAVTWYDSYGKAAIATINAEDNNIIMAAEASNENGLVAACQQLEASAATAAKHVPPVYAKGWSTAVSYLYWGAKDCVTGFTTSNAALITKGGNNFGTGYELFATETTAIQKDA